MTKCISANLGASLHELFLFIAQFGGINPSLYLNPEQFDKEEDFPEHHLGRVYFNIYYDEIDEALNVYIQKIRNLPKSTIQAGKTNKTYIK